MNVEDADSPAFQKCCHASSHFAIILYHEASRSVAAGEPERDDLWAAVAQALVTKQREDGAWAVTCAVRTATTMRNFMCCNIGSTLEF